VLAENLVLEALHAERDLVALVLRGLDRFRRERRVCDRRVLFDRRRGSLGSDRCGFFDRLLPAPKGENGDAGGAAQQDDQDGCRDAYDECSRPASFRRDDSRMLCSALAEESSCRSHPANWTKSRRACDGWSHAIPGS
jgi:hypothetical protein